MIAYARAGRRTVLAAAGMAAAAHYVPSVLTVPQLNRVLTPRLAGRSAQPHIALTFDDGPDPRSTPAFLDELARLRMHATFFLLGEQVAEASQLAGDIVAAGHEVAVHGWRHRPHLLRAPWRVGPDLARARDLIADATGVSPAFWRPPNGILSGAGLLAAHRIGLQPVLWTADGRDWDAGATPASVAARIRGRLEPGGTVLLHDSDITSAPQSWRAALGALDGVAAYCAAQGWSVGPLREHWAGA